MSENTIRDLPPFPLCDTLEPELLNSTHEKFVPESDDIQMFEHGTTVDADKTSAELESLIACEMANLSVQERETVYHDVHGVSDRVDETPKLLSESLAAFDRALMQIPEKKGYDMALKLGSEHVTSPSFRMRFLRCERFDISKAVERFIIHFDVKLELFGPDLLCRDITQSDLDQDVIESLYKSAGIRVPLRDRTGRLVFVKPPEENLKNNQAILQRNFYGGLLYSEEEETQKSGVVVIPWIYGRSLSFDLIVEMQKCSQQLRRVQQAIPLRFEVFHCCTDSYFWSTLFALVNLAATSFTRLRTKVHIGGVKEVFAELQAFGIPTHAFPVWDDGSIMREQVAEAWVKVKLTEQQGTPGDVRVRTISPNPNDVLLGRGKLFYAHEGNVRFRSLILQALERYNKSKYSQKTHVCFSILGLIKERSGRFLKNDGGFWAEVEDDVAMKKISHAFRTLRGNRNSNSNPRDR